MTHIEKGISVICLLVDGPQTAQDIAIQTGMHQDAIRRHLRALERANLIHAAGTRRTGKKGIQPIEWAWTKGQS